MKRLAISTTTKERDPVIISSFNYDEDYNFWVSQYALAVENTAGDTLMRYSIQRTMKTEYITMNNGQIHALEITMPMSILMIQVKPQDKDKLIDIKYQIESKVNMEANKARHNEHILSLL